MTDILKTLTDAEFNRAKVASIGDDQFAEDCYQLIRYRRQMIFNREQAERGLLKIRQMTAV